MSNNLELVEIAVNGTLMRGFALNPNLLVLGAKFIREDRTAPVYRLWTIGDKCPAMQRDDTSGASIDLEIWELPGSALTTLLQKEPPGLCLGKIELVDGSLVLGILGEAALTLGQREITSFGGWGNYRKSMQE
ncbi:MAG TPA: hypothetical protein PKD55_04065 [Bellilinea sp.]|nr:hypothetical protein [Bellilinea sp.]